MSEAIEKLVDRDGAAEILGVCPRTVTRLVGCGLPHVRMPGSGTKPVIRYIPSSLLVWAKARETVAIDAPKPENGDAPKTTTAAGPGGTVRLGWLESLDRKAKPATLGADGTARPQERSKRRWGA